MGYNKPTINVDVKTTVAVSEVVLVVNNSQPPCFTGHCCGNYCKALHDLSSLTIVIFRFKNIYYL